MNNNKPLHDSRLSSSTSLHTQELNQRRWRALLAIVLLVLAGCSRAPAPPPENPTTRPLTTQATQSPQSFETTKFLLYLPTDYATSDKRWPMILSLHGKSLRGDDLEMLKSYGLASLLDKGLSIPFVVVSPQCPADSDWTSREAELNRLVDDIALRYQIDHQRIYLTGHSMGGRGTWFLAYKHPEKFAAIIPLADAPPDDSWAMQIAKVPVWTFHGTKDDLAPFERTEKFVETLKTLGADIKFTPLPDRDHFILDVYQNKNIYDWLLQHKSNWR